VSVEAITLTSTRIPKLSEMPVPIAPRMPLAIAVIRKTTKMTPRPGAAEGVDHTAALDHDHGRDHGPDRQQDQAGDDEEEEADADAKAGEDAGTNQRQDHGPGRLDQFADRGVAAAVLDVAHESHDHALVERRGDDADREPQRQQDQAAGDDAVDHRDEQEEPEGDGQQHTCLVAVGGEDLTEGAAYIELSFHARCFDPAAYDPPHAASISPR